MGEEEFKKLSRKISDLESENKVLNAKILNIKNGTDDLVKLKLNELNESYKKMMDETIKNIFIEKLKKEIKIRRAEFYNYCERFQEDINKKWNNDLIEPLTDLLVGYTSQQASFEGAILILNNISKIDFDNVIIRLNSGDSIKEYRKLERERILKFFGVKE